MSDPLRALQTAVSDRDGVPDAPVRGSRTGSEVTGLDWRHSRHWGRGRRRPCRICQRPAFLLDDEGQPCHKTCAEQEQHARQEV
jgi:hypothetical protein